MMYHRVSTSDCALLIIIMKYLNINLLKIGVLNEDIFIPELFHFRFVDFIYLERKISFD